MAHTSKHPSDPPGAQRIKGAPVSTGVEVIALAPSQVGVQKSDQMSKALRSAQTINTAVREQSSNNNGSDSASTLRRRASQQYYPEELYEKLLRRLISEQDEKCACCGLLHADCGGVLTLGEFSAHHILWAGAYGTNHHHNRAAICSHCHRDVIHGDRKTGPAYALRRKDASGLNPRITRAPHQQHDCPTGKTLIVPFREAWSTLPPEMIENFAPVGRAKEYEKRMTEADREEFRKCRTEWGIESFHLP